MKKIIVKILLGLMFTLLVSSIFANELWQAQWPKTDFAKTNIDLNQIISGGPAKDGIPSIDNPQFKNIDEINNLGDKEPVISLSIDNDSRAYPIRILMFHEIVNDTLANIPLAITYCPLCNASLVFERKIDNQILDFGTTGKLRHSDMVMYDRQTQSWWQQFTGEAIVGEYMGKKLKIIPSRIESFALFKKRNPQGKVLVPNNPNARDYGSNPYVSYDSTSWPFLFNGKYEKQSIPALSRVVAIGNDAWPLSLVAKNKQIEYKEMIITWQKGQNSALDSYRIDKGKDIGNVTVTKDGKDIVYHLPFAFAFFAFNPEGRIHTEVND